MLQVCVLGPVEVRRDDEAVPVPAGKASELLVRLAVDAGVLVRAERLMEDLWPDDVSARRNTLQSKVTMLRRALGDPDLITFADQGYRLVVDPAAVDAVAVLGRAASAARLLEAGDARGAVAASASGLALFDGEPLLGGGSGEWVAPHRARFVEVQIALLETWFGARAEVGDDADLIGELELAVATHPFQEGLWRLLITALYRAGRQADALAAYQRVRTQLATELGLDAGPQLQELERRVLDHDPSLLAPPAGAAPPAAPVEPVARRGGNLPSIATDLIGRDAELASLAEVLGARRLVNLVGTGGIGKTALAIEVARRAAPAGGAWLARLETATNAAEVVDAVVAAAGASSEEALIERLRSMPALLVLDNCEHLVDAVADLAIRLLDVAPQLHVLCTSQVVLGIEGETLYHLDPLDAAASVDLFTRLAEAQRRIPQLAGSGGAIEELCRSLDGLPLAIELAAARTRSLSVEEIVRRLDDRLDVLHDPTSRRPERRRALRSTIGWSYDLLFPDDQRGLWALATFAGGAPLQGVEAVLDALEVPARAAIDVIDRLVGRSLVLVDEVDGVLRYRLLDSIRAFALEAMGGAGLADRAHGAHASWYLDAAQESTERVRGPEQAAALAFARLERANIDAALTWFGARSPRGALAMANGFGWAWVVIGDRRGADRLVAALAAAGPDAPAADRAAALLLTGWIVASTGDLERAHEHIAGAVSLVEGDLEGEVRSDLLARAAYFLAYVVSHDGEFARAVELTAEATRRYDDLDRPWDQAAARLFSARAFVYLGDGPQAAAALAHAQGWVDAVDDPWLRARAAGIAGERARIEHRFDDAVDLIAWAAAEAGRLGFLQTEAYQLSSLGRAQALAGDPAEGAVTLERAVGQAEAIGDVRMAALARVHLARLRRGLGDEAGARTALEPAVAWHRAAGGGEQAALGECLLAAMDGAEPELRTILDEARGGDVAHVEVFALDALARIASDGGDQPAADGLLAQADARMEAASGFVSEQDRVDARAVRARR